MLSVLHLSDIFHTVWSYTIIHYKIQISYKINTSTKYSISSIVAVYVHTLSILWIFNFFLVQNHPELKLYFAETCLRFLTPIHCIIYICKHLAWNFPFGLKLTRIDLNHDNILSSFNDDSLLILIAEDIHCISYLTNKFEV